ncbi:MAG: type I-E CRISPR-associated protein Cas7/Cse4/CasC [Planctomycetia bacterium]|nr:type I-E CRISPR-associated protein Cas7/Cse4/CasC [Planctomycetia bacterium]
MSRFVQLHVLTSYPPSNLNRDDLGRPKSALVGGVARLRVSSQSGKRAWRTSDLFQDALAGHLGTRTKTLGLEIFKKLAQIETIDAESLKHFKEAKFKLAHEGTRKIIEQFGSLEADYPPKKVKAHAPDDASNDESKADDDSGDKALKAFRKSLSTSQLVHISPAEHALIDALTNKLADAARLPTAQELELLREDHHAVDIALFGRMLAEKPRFNIEAAAQVAHAFTVHKASAEDDYFTAVDDLNRGERDAGAAHIGEAGFGAGVYYLYVCINRDLLDTNLGGDTTLRNKALAALLEAIAKVAPTGKQASFASRAYASYMLVEKGSQQPRSLSLAFVKPVNGTDMIQDSIEALNDKRQNMDKVYGDCADARKFFNAETGEGSLAELIAFAQAD